MLLYLAWRLLAPLARALPLSIAYILSNAMMDAVLWAWPRGRRAMRANLQVVLDTDDPAILNYWAGRQLRRYGEYLVDALRLDMLTPQESVQALETDDWLLADEAIAAGPVIFAVMHFGNWDVAAAAVAARGQPGYVLVESLGHPQLDIAVQRSRARLGSIPIAIEDGALPVLRVLKAGATVGILFDRPLPPDTDGVDVTFFGRPCRLPSGLARLALASGARVVPLGVARLPGRGFRFWPLLDFHFTSPRTGDRDRDVQTLTQRVLDVYEGWVRRYPDQWYQFRPFFLAASAQQPAEAS